MHLHTMDQDLKTHKDNAHKAYLIVTHLRLKIYITNFSIWIKLKRGMLYIMNNTQDAL